MPLRRLKNISKKYVFSVTPLRRLKNITRKSSKIIDYKKCVPQKILCGFRRVIRISDKTDVEPLETVKKWSVFWE